MWVGELPAKTAVVTALAFAPGGRALYTADNLGSVLARGLRWLWPTPDGRRLLIQDEHRLIDALHAEAGPLLDPGSGERGYWTYLFPDGRTAVKGDPDRDW